MFDDVNLRFICTRLFSSRWHNEAAGHWWRWLTEGYSTNWLVGLQRIHNPRDSPDVGPRCPWYLWGLTSKRSNVQTYRYVFGDARRTVRVVIMIPPFSPTIFQFDEPEQQCSCVVHNFDMIASQPLDGRKNTRRKAPSQVFCKLSKLYYRYTN